MGFEKFSQKKNLIVEKDGEKHKSREVSEEENVEDSKKLPDKDKKDMKPEEFNQRLNNLKEKNKEKANSLLDNLNIEYDNLNNQKDQVDEKNWRKKVDKIMKKIKRVFYTGIKIAVISGMTSPLDAGNITKEMPFEHLREVEEMIKETDISVDIDLADMKDMKYTYFNKEDVKIYFEEAVKFGVEQYRIYAAESGEEIEVPKIEIVIAKKIGEIETESTVGAYVPELDKIIMNPKYAKVLTINPHGKGGPFFEKIGPSVFATIMHETLHAIDYKMYPNMRENELICLDWWLDKSLPRDTKEMNLRINQKNNFTKYTEKNAMNVQINFFEELLNNADNEIKELKKKIQQNVGSIEKEEYEKKIEKYKKHIEFLAGSIKGIEEQLIQVNNGTYNNLNISTENLKQKVIKKMFNEHLNKK